MSKKKMRKSKKRAPLKSSNKNYSDWFTKDPVSGKEINVSDLMRRYDELTDFDSLYILYGVYNNPDNPLFDRRKADQVMDKLAELGEPQVCAKKGCDLFYEGKKEEAFPYLVKGVKTGESAVLNNLGLCYCDRKEIGEAIKCFEVLAHRRDPDGYAAFNTYALYNQDGKYQNYEKAQKYFEIAYKKGFSNAQNVAWERFLYEPINHYNEKLGFSALTHDIVNNKKDALFELEYSYITTSMSDRKFLLFLLKFPDQSERIIHYLADCYMFGLGTKPDMAMALKYYRQLKDNGLVKVMLSKVDLIDPFGSLIEAAKSNKACCYYAGMMAMHGTYGEPNPYLAKSLFEKGMSTRYMQNQYALAHLYLNERELQDFPQALKLLKEYKAHSNSQFDLMRLRDLFTIYVNGIGTEKDFVTAEIYARSIIANHDETKVVRMKPFLSLFPFSRRSKLFIMGNMSEVRYLCGKDISF